MTTLEVLHWLQNNPPGHTIRKANVLVGATLQVFHIMGFLLLLASALIANLRIFGLALRSVPASGLARAATRLLWLGFGTAFISGSLIFCSGAVRYYANPAFRLKLLLMLLAVLFQLGIHRRLAAQPQSGAALIPRAAAGLSLALWLSVAAAGRAIGYI